MSMGQEITDLTAKVKEQATLIEGLEAQIEAATQLDNAKAEASIKVAQDHEAKVKDLEEQLQAAQTDLAGALEVNEELLEDTADAEDKAELAEAAVEAASVKVVELQEVVIIKDAKLAMPAIKDASAEGEELPADIDASEPINILAQYAAITDSARRHEFWSENKEAIAAANAEAKAAANEKE